jgi:hypothetical protein
LNELFALADARSPFIFKGGTSLSKVWKAIHRFSEDIDISLSREWLGFSGTRDPESAVSRKQRERLIEQLSAACAARVLVDLAPALQERVAEVFGTNGWAIEASEEDPQTLSFRYPSTLATSATGGYVRSEIRIECVARSDRWPAAEQTITSYVAEAFPRALPDAAFALPVLDIERSFWEKATILHAEAHRAAGTPIPERFSRHYSDLVSLSQHAKAQEALTRDDLRARVVEHKSVFFRAAWASYDTAVPGTFRLVPSAERLIELERDYAAMHEMFFRTPLSWSEVVARLKELEKSINGKAPRAELA